MTTDTTELPVESGALVKALREYQRESATWKSRALSAEGELQRLRLIVSDNNAFLRKLGRTLLTRSFIQQSRPDLMVMASAYIGDEVETPEAHARRRARFLDVVDELDALLPELGKFLPEPR
jgi:hypothetical protein